MRRLAGTHRTLPAFQGAFARAPVTVGSAAASQAAGNSLAVLPNPVGRTGAGCQPLQRQHGVVPAQSRGHQSNSGPADGGAQARGQPKRGADQGRPSGQRGESQQLGDAPLDCPSRQHGVQAAAAATAAARAAHFVCRPSSPTASSWLLPNLSARCTPSWTSAEPTPTLTPTSPLSLPAGRACPSRCTCCLRLALLLIAPVPCC